jgi:Zn-dependent peptidase ImmA (M78 family)
MTFEELGKLSDLYRVSVDALLRPPTRPACGDDVPVEWAFDVPGGRPLDRHDVSEIEAFVGALRAEQRRWGDEAPDRSTAGDICGRGDPRTVADEVRARLSLTSPPVNVHKALAAHDIRVHVTPLHTISGALIRESSTHRLGVLVNANQPWDRQRHSAAHELGHLVLGHASPRRSRIVSPLGRRVTPRELDADDFASELLMPSSLVHEELRALSPSKRPLESLVSTLADRFLVSGQAMVCRLAALNVITALDKNRLLATRARDTESAGEGRRDGRIPFDAEIFAAATDTALVLRAVGSLDGVRALQDIAFEEYSRAVAATQRSDSAGDVYEKVALWVAAAYPAAGATTTSDAG